MSMIIHPAEQGTDAWLAARSGVVTASSMAKVMSKGRGKAPSKTRMSYMIKKATEIINEKPVSGGFQSDAMRNGTEMEPSARAYYTMLYGVPVEQVGVIYLNEQKRIGASVDGLVGEDGLLEIKCPNLDTHVNYMLDGVMPVTYIKQVQSQMWITGRKWCDFLSYHPESHKIGFKVRVDRDDEFIETISEAVYKFIGDMDALVIRMRAM